MIELKDEFVVELLAPVDVLDEMLLLGAIGATDDDGDDDEVKEEAGGGGGGPGVG